MTAPVIADGDVREVTVRLVGDDRVAAVTLTGGNRAGPAAGSAAGPAAKKSVLELGGSDAFVVLGGADVAKSAAAAVRARFTNSGQSCVCAKRFIVDASLSEPSAAATAVSSPLPGAVNAPTRARIGSPAAAVVGRRRLGR
ncbi:aldehyde dehydrogenase family protein [Streptomyces bicolor]|uniref:aldehyde dehydrogenase family protein n=1 Tax=Streptomyces bicolor TaxID=66874 RepID=UPI0004E2540F|nr:aldehyde dehydrogenase family protein [Streptomyces bicolor]